MTTPRRRPRSGFTLTELLVAITVLAILAGFLAPVIMNSLTTAKEAAVIFEMKQMELAIEQFKNDHGFYPPSIDIVAANGAAIQNLATFQQYLNKIAPQNAENSTSFPGSTNSRLLDWWNNVGSQMDETTSLQFWLSGMCKNKQFPLTGGVSVDTNGATTGVMTICAFEADKYSDGTDFPEVPDVAVALEVERDNYYEFKSKQVEVVAGGNGMPASSAFGATYKQPFGPTSGDLRFRYLDYKSYTLNDGMNTPRAYCDGLDSAGNPLYLNPRKFQLVSYGRDGLPGNPGDVSAAGREADDNICNFVEGRLENYFNQ